MGIIVCLFISPNACLLLQCPYGHHISEILENINKLPTLPAKTIRIPQNMYKFTSRRAVQMDPNGEIHVEECLVSSCGVFRNDKPLKPLESAKHINQTNL